MERTDPVMKTDQTIQLSDGRTLGFAEYGSPEGQVLVYCQGTPGSRLEAAALATYATAAHVRVLSIDRPGYGRSSFQQGRSLLDWPTDLVALAERLGIDRFGVLGVSGGAPYALACAYRLPARLLSCGVMSGVGPLTLGVSGMSLQNRLGFFLARRAPWSLPLLLSAPARTFRDEAGASKTIPKMLKQMTKPDREAILAHDIVDQLAADAREAFHQGIQGAIYELRLYSRDWGFRLEDVAFQPLYLWHGALDTNVPIGMARAMAKRLPDCSATFYPDEGHLSTLLNHQQEVFAALFPTTAETA